MQKFKNFMLPIAMAIGTIFYNWIEPLSFLMPYLLFLMLLFTFIRITPKEVKITTLHLWLIAIQLVGSLIVYLSLVYFDVAAAEGIMICILAPSATAAAVITGILGGSISFVTAYVILSNTVVSIVAPIMFSFIGINRNMPFVDSVGTIAMEVIPLLIFPLLLAWFIDIFIPAVKTKMLRYDKLPLYLWALSLIIVTARTVSFIFSQDSSKYKIILVISLASMVVCIAQFLLGRFIGRRYNNTISAGQSLGQKNTVLAIWMSQIYLSPLASLAPSFYILWQNIINSYQLWRKMRKKG